MIVPVIYAENGTVLRSFTGKNQRSTVDRHLSQTELTQKDDSQTVENWQHAGFRSIPPVNSRQFVDCFSNHYRASTAEDDKIVHSGLSVGETIVYSSLSGAIKAYIKALVSGILELNGNTDFAVRYTALETAFNELKSAYNSHNHGGSGTNTPSSADITATKVDTVKLP